MTFISVIIYHISCNNNHSLQFWIGVSTARQIILDVCMVIWDVLTPIYMSVPSEDKWKSIADEFYERWNFPNCIGAIDGKHIMIQCPINSGSLFYNYKSYFSIALLAVASAEMFEHIEAVMIVVS